MFGATDDQVWDMLAQRLGEEKVAYLRYAPLDIIVGQYIQNKMGSDFGGQFTIMDGIAYAVAQQKLAEDERREIDEAIKVADALGVTLDEPRGDSIYHKLADVVKLAQLETALPDMAEKLSSVRYDIEDEIVDSLYDAFNDEKTASAMSALRGVADSSVAHSAAKGLAGGTAAAVPLYMAGDHLANKKIEDAKGTALSTAAGAAALLGGGMALGGYLGSKSAEHKGLEAALLIDQIVDKTASYGAYRMNRAVICAALADIIAGG